MSHVRQANFRPETPLTPGIEIAWRQPYLLSCTLAPRLRYMLA
jgi:hypothetical protein